jgi:hypothetical protein
MVAMMAEQVMDEEMGGDAMCSVEEVGGGGEVRPTSSAVEWGEGVQRRAGVAPALVDVESIGGKQVQLGGGSGRMGRWGWGGGGEGKGRGQGGR